MMCVLFHCYRIAPSLSEACQGSILTNLTQSRRLSFTEDHMTYFGKDERSYFMFPEITGI